MLEIVDEVDVLNNEVNYVIELYEYIDKNNIFIVDNKNVILDYSLIELEVAFWLTITFNENIYLVPKVSYSQNISTPDFIMNGEKWDLKEIYGNSKNTIDRSIRYKGTQSNNFIIDISNSPMGEFDAIMSIISIYKSEHRDWVNQIILKKDDKFLLFKRKRG